MKRLALVLALCLVALPAKAWNVYDDTALTPSDPNDRIIISADTVSTDQASIAFTTPTTARYLLITVDVTVCTGSCLFRIWLDEGLPDGTWIAHYTVTSTMDLSAVSKKEFLFGHPGGSISNTQYEVVTTGVPLPGLWRVRAVWTSGTSASYTVGAASW